MKLLIAADIFPPESGGPATYAVTLANELARRGVEVTIVSLNPDSDRTRVEGARLFPVRTRSKLYRYLSYTALLFREARESDIIYAMGPVNAGLPAWIASRMRGKQLVVKVVGDYAWEQGTQRFGVTDLIDDFQTKKYSFPVMLLKRLQSFVVRRADLVIAPSRYLAQMVCGWGAREGAVQVVYNAVKLSNEEARFTAEKQSLRERWLVSVGRLVPWKGMGTLVEVVAELASTYPDVRLKIIGDGPERRRLEEQIAALSVEDKVQLLGNLPRQDTLAYIHSSDLLILNSAYEGLSHVLVEALGFTTMVVASSAGGNPEVVIPGQTGELFPYNDKAAIRTKIEGVLNGTIKNPLRDSKGRPEVLKQFELEEMIAQTKAILEKVCATR